nr:hypothetical protein BaRGS_016036 [Batillaria attramentaria]
MEIGNEISQKIRSAIKAKLVELGAYVDEELPDYIMEVKGKRAREVESGTEIDSRVVEYEPESVASSVEEEKSVESGSQGIPEILDVEPDEFVLDPDLEAVDSSMLFEEDKRLVDMKEKQKDKTRFVVTLDGVDEEEYETSMMESQETILEGESMGAPMEVDPVALASGKEAVALSMHRPPPKVQQFSINLKDSDEEAEPMQEEATPLMRAKMMESCKNKERSCPFFHPTLPGKDKLKWQAGKTTAASAEAAAPTLVK